MRSTFPAIAVIVTLLAATAAGQDAGTVVSVVGTVEIGRGETWSNASPGDPLRVGDRLRTGSAARAHLLLQDESILSLSDDVELLVREQQLEPPPQISRTTLDLIQGRIKAVVGDRYRQAGASFEIETPTAVATVRGTEFVIVFDPVADTTSVAGVSGKVVVNSVIDRARSGVLIDGRKLTTVARGEFPSAPIPIEETTFRQLLDGLSFSSPGAGGLSVSSALVGGADMPSSDRAAALPPPPAPEPVAPPEPAAEVVEDRYTTTIDQPPAVIDEIQEQVGDLGVRF